MSRTYLAIDLKSFYASSECADRHLDPLNTHLVVADPSRTDKTICLAVSPSLKSLGLAGRSRLFEVIQRVKEVNRARLTTAIQHHKIRPDAQGRYAFSSSSYDAGALAADPTLELSYIVAPPRMARYMEVSAQIYATYLKFISPEDIFQYSIDEVFIDATSYLDIYHLSPRTLAMKLIREVLGTTGITATCGIGTNLYLAKIALDIEAKHVPADKDGVRIAELDEYTYRKLLWDHKPLTDFWRFGPGTARRLEMLGITTMGELARTSVHDQERFYNAFGVDAEILIDHAWGVEPTTMEYIKKYRPETNCLCEGQVLMSPYPYEKAQIIVREMTESLMLQLADKNLATDSLTLDLGYDRENIDNGIYKGELHIDHYGRAVPKPAHGSTKLKHPTNLESQ
ncbi:MAG: DNA methylase, partial [Porphyromonadaceae bacterium]|nr:DNA methylase [Porphyromonadaceae bacterium]